MKATKNSQKILKDYLSIKLTSEEFDEAIKHQEFTENQKLKLIDAYFESIGVMDVTEQFVGQASINIRLTRD
jgi:F0F1-type ATP synthase delta subunit